MQAHENVLRDKPAVLYSTIKEAPCIVFCEFFILKRV
jgi:hypothetical protein